MVKGAPGEKSSVQIGRIREDNYLSEEDDALLSSNAFVLAEKPVPVFYGATSEDVNTIGLVFNG